jgi:hypothetical protein
MSQQVGVLRRLVVHPPPAPPPPLAPLRQTAPAAAAFPGRQWAESPTESAGQLPAAKGGPAQVNPEPEQDFILAPAARAGAAEAAEKGRKIPFSDRTRV